MNVFGKKIKELREERGLFQRHLCVALEIDTPMYSKIERGERKAKRSQIPIMAKVFGVDEKELKKGLKEILPEAAFFGEESAKGAFPEEEYVFVADPIDGTTNFIKDLRWSCTAVALAKNRERIFGAVYNPYSDELFWAVRGKGAFLNETPISVSELPLERGLAVFGTAPYYEDIPEHAFDKAKEYLEKCIDVRRTGSAELDLCLVACGRCELYFEPRIQPWDYAAGSIIVEEAGGTVCQWDGTPFDITKPASCMAFGRGVSISRL